MMQRPLLQEAVGVAVEEPQPAVEVHNEVASQGEAEQVLLVALVAVAVALVAAVAVAEEVVVDMAVVVVEV